MKTLASNRIVMALAALVLIAQPTFAADQPAWSPINLTRYYNSFLTNSVLCKTTDKLENSLSPLPRGRQNHASVPFEIQGVIQLSGMLLQNDGKTFPQKVEGIEINQNFDRIQLLHAVGYHDLPGSTVAWLILNYEDQKQEKIAIKYQEHVLDWWDVNKEKVTGKNSEVAWTGSTPMAEAANATVRLFRTVFENPRPGVKVTTITYQSGNRLCAPFLVAMTLETGPKP